MYNATPYLQIEYVLQEKPQLKDTKDWKELYASLRRKYGLREEFTEMIMLCRKCCALFWKSLGHPCFVLAEEAAAEAEKATLPAEVENKKGELIPVSPKSFLTFFSVWLANQMICLRVWSSIFDILT